MTHLANSLAFWPPHRPHACGRHTVQEWTSGSGTQDAGAACRRRWDTGGERRTSGKRSEIRAGSDKCFLTPCEERRGVCLAKRPGKGTEEEEERTEEREEERG